MFPTSGIRPEVSPFALRAAILILLAVAAVSTFIGLLAQSPAVIVAAGFATVVLALTTSIRQFQAALTR
ncbi:MAG: hypothetical protein Q4B10_02115 [Actinomycetaceae bacterium]|nr:hypothetical protein [Actinomycetaceae bacterium]